MGNESRGYHLTSLLLHAANTALLYLLALRLLAAATPRAAARSRVSLALACGFAALLFGLHPLRAESVVWVTERRDVLSGFFFLSTLLLYASGRRRAALAAFAASLLSKAAGVGLPLVLFALDVYPLRRLRGPIGDWLSPEAMAVWREKIPFIALAALATVVGIYTQGHSGAMWASVESPLSRLARAFYGAAFYARKTFLPFGLSPLYGIDPVESPLSMRVRRQRFGRLAAGAVAFWRRRTWPALAVVCVAYLALLLPVLGLVRFGAYLAADRYSYLSCLGWPLLLGAGLLRSWNALSSRGRPLLPWHRRRRRRATGGARPGGRRWFGATLSLWRQAVAVDPAHVLGHLNLGLLAYRQGKLDEAAMHFRRDVIRDPRRRSWRATWARCWLSQAAEEAARQFLMAARLKPDDVEAIDNLAKVLNQLGRHEAAARGQLGSLRLAPSDALAHENLADALSGLGRLDEAIVEYPKSDETEDRFDLEPTLSWAEIWYSSKASWTKRFPASARRCGSIRVRRTHIRI